MFCYFIALYLSSLFYIVLLSGSKLSLKFLLFFTLKKLKMSLAATLRAWLALVPAEVLGEDTRLEVIIQNGRLEANEAKVPQKVSQDLNK